jgi:DNA-binding CsgD family transcriptional regulator
VAGKVLAQALVGRADELDLIGSSVGGTAMGGAALLLTGEPGMGKSALLDVAAELAAAAGTRVLRAAGVEFEAEVSFSALDQLLAPLRADFSLLSATYRGALSVALGLGDGPSAERLVLCNAALELLRRTADARRVLIIVDDVQWLDQASAVVLAFVGRRLPGARVGLIAASRPGSGGPLAVAGLPEHFLRPLDDRSAARLLSTRFPMLAAGVHRRVLAEARGNPLALTELPAALTIEQRSGAVPLPPVLPLNHQLDALFASQVGELPVTSRALLLLAALEQSGDIAILDAAARSFNAQGGFASVERSRLVSIDENYHRLVFRHPLARAAMVAASTGIERRRAHRALAEALVDQPDRRAWHLAEATVPPDEQVADLLERTAQASLRRGDAVGAEAALTRAAELSEHRLDRGRRLVEAAYLGAEVTGQLASAAQLLTDARQAGPEAATSLKAAIAASYLLLNAECDIDSAHRLLAGAIMAYGDRYDANDETLIDALHSLVMIAWFGGRPELWKPFNDAVDRIIPAAPDLLVLCAKAFGDPVRQAASALDQLAAAFDTLRDEFNPVQITRVAIACVYTDRLGDCREALNRVIRDGREGGAIALAINAVVSSCVDDWLTGQWDEALDLAAEGLQMSEEHGYRRYSVILGGYIRALIMVAKGNADQGLASADEMAEWAGARGVGMAATFSHHVRALCAITLGEFEEAYRHASAISPAGVLPAYTPHALWVLMDLVESAVRTGRHEQARAHVAAMRAADIAAISPRLAVVFASCEAMAAPADEAVALYEEAVATPGAGRWPLELARVELAYGELLRRRKAVTDARLHLRSALDIFRRLGAQPWAMRAASELRAAGLPVSHPDRPSAPSLTPQELEIAALAASGLTNKQIAGRLYLSHRTVSARLYQLFPKLGVTSRAALRDALAAARRDQ